jgi:hypothetical protein
MMPLLLAPVEDQESIGGARSDSGTNTEVGGDGWPSLYYAAEAGLKAIVGARLAVGADIETRDSVRRWWVQGESVLVRCGSYWFGFMSFGTEGSLL